MKIIKIKPEKEQKTLWLIYWFIPFVLVLILCLVLTFILKYPGNLILGICSIIWIVKSILIALWIPAYYNSLEYIMDNDSVQKKNGVFWKKTVTVPYTKITNIDISQGPFERIYGIGKVAVQTAGAGGAQGTQAELKLCGLKDLDEMKEKIMDQIKNHYFGIGEAKTKQKRIPDSDVFDKILAELSAIRKALKKK